MRDAYCVERKHDGKDRNIQGFITIAKELQYIQDAKESELLEKLDHICRMIPNLIKKL